MRTGLRRFCLLETATRVIGWAACIFAVLWLGPVSVLKAATIFSVDLQGSGPIAPIDYSGPEALATAANAAFGAASVWNHFTIPGGAGAHLTDPSFSNLVDSTGTVTSVGFSITGTVSGWSLAGNVDGLRDDYFFFTHSANITWQITGLAPLSEYDLYLYGFVHGPSTPFTMQIGSTSQSVTQNGVLFSSVLSDGSGTISGLGISSAGIINEADWSGFQLVSDATGTPEPSYEVLLGLGTVGVLWIRRIKRKAAQSRRNGCVARLPSTN